MSSLPAPREDSPYSELLMRNQERFSSEENAQKSRVPSDTLRRAPLIVITTLAYAAIALFAWTVLCILSHRPIGAQSYKPDLRSEDGFWDYMEYVDSKQNKFGQTDHFLRAARVFQSLASVLTIPLTSMVCSCAAVAFLQKRSQRSSQGPTLRQSMALADKGWNDPVIISKLVAGGWKRYGSTFLAFAILLNVIGASIAPFQGLFISYESTKVPSEMNSMDLVDLRKWVNFAADPIHDSDAAIPMMQLRSRLMSTSNEDPQFRLWSRGAGCNNSSDESNEACTKSGQSTFGIMSNITDPFWAQPHVGFQTGLWQQFAPRVNFTTKYENIAADDFPSDCRDRPGALFIHYENMTDIGGYIVDVCMPGDQTKSPWKATRKRQEFSEDLFIIMTLDWDVASQTWEQGTLPFLPGNYSFKITLNTTAGYFELPNYNNGKLPGPLLDDLDGGLEEDCGQQCKNQASTFDRKKRYFVTPVKNDTETALANFTRSVSPVVSKGPLLNTAMALFTTGSYLDIQHTVAEAYSQGSLNEWGGCIDVLPMVKLLRGTDGTRVSTDLDPCVYGADTVQGQLPMLVAGYIWLFAGQDKKTSRITTPSPKHIEEAFNAAAFIAVDEWMQRAYSDFSEFDTSGSVSWDLGVDQEVPNIPRAGVVLISILLGTYLICILGLSVYATWTPRWTNQLDSFAMMRIGSAALESFPLRLAHNPDEVKELDNRPGWIGSTTGAERDASDGNGCVSELELGGEEPLNLKKRYRCYTTEESSLLLPS